jgi:hypothetical protein
MQTIAQTPCNAPQGRLVPSFFLARPLLRWVGVWGLVVLTAPVVAQEVIYRCGNEYTNAPRAGVLCEQLATQAVTVISGTRPVAATQRPNPGVEPAPKAGSSVLKPAALPPSGEPLRQTNPAQSERDAQARDIVSLELTKAREQLAQLQQAYQQGEPEKWASESRNHQKYLDRVAGLKAQIERTERDIDSLQRELARRPLSPKMAQNP